MSPTTERLSAALADRYRIERRLGEGGMATVYLAEDLKHKRKVALKVLKPELAAVLGAERFVQEITTTAALQHPHILPLFDSGTADGFLFYVMPFIDGETLRGRLDRETQLGIEEAVKITVEVADALHHAHQHGVIHRDIKPENILLQDGRPMVADFGIALAVSAAAGGRMTETGLSLGTPHYMSPEQATAEKEITARSDVYSLGSVMYEMLTGTPPHTGASAQQIIMKIVTEEATLVTRHRRSVPANVAAAIARSLEKLPADRFESAKAFGEALGNAAFVGNPRVGGRSATSARPALSRMQGAAALLAAALIGALGWNWLATRGADGTGAPLFLPLAITDPPRAPYPWGAGALLAPDGQRIAYIGQDRGWWLLDLRKEGHAGTPTAIRGISVGFSPTGDSLAHTTSYWVQQTHVTDLSTGGPLLVTDSAQGKVTWSDDGWLYYRDQLNGLRRARVADQVREVLVTPQPGENWYTVNPQPLPGGRGVLYARVPLAPRNPGRAEIMVLDLKSGASSPLGRGVEAKSPSRDTCWWPRWTAPCWPLDSTWAQCNSEGRWSRSWTTWRPGVSGMWDRHSRLPTMAR